MLSIYNLGLFIVVMADSQEWETVVDFFDSETSFCIKMKVVSRKEKKEGFLFSYL